MIDSVSSQQLLWLESASLAMRHWSIRKDGKDWFIAQVCLLGPAMRNEYVEWVRAEDEILNVAAAKAFLAAEAKGKPQTPTEAFGNYQRMSAEKDAEIERLKAQLEAQAAKAKPSEPPKAPAKQ
jgi:hypothetical protein